MLVLGPIGFLSPALLWALAALPVLWVLLRAVPPAPIRRRFPGVALLLGLKDDDSTTDRTPWWLLLLRMAAAALVILGFAGPVLNPDAVPEDQSAPLLVVVDGGWGDARDWPQRLARLETAISEARRDGRPVALVQLTDPPSEIVWQDPEDLADRLPGLSPRPWEPAPDAHALLALILPEGRFDTLWLSDGLARAGQDALARDLAARGRLSVALGSGGVRALGPARIDQGAAVLPVLRVQSGQRDDVEVVALGLDPAGIERELARATARFEADARRAEARFDLPPELRNRLTRFQIPGETSAGATVLTGDALRRPKVAIVSDTGRAEGLELLAPDYYLRRALDSHADLIEGTIADVLRAAPDVVILADIAQVAESQALSDWVASGGLLLRFAGPHLAGSDVGRDGLDPLLPVRLRLGGRSSGGTMSWGQPQGLAPFEPGSPFAGLPIPPDVTVRAQVLAQPGPDLAQATIARLSDGTPLVTRRVVGQGQIVLFHVTANAEWSSLPLSGLFVQMLERLAIAGRPAGGDPEDLTGTTWVAERVLDGFGALQEAADMGGVPGERLDLPVGPDLPPGLYRSDRSLRAVNVIAQGRELMPAEWPAGAVIEGMSRSRELPLKGWALAAALTLLLTDALASLALSGRLSRGVAALVVLALLVPAVRPAHAQQEDRLIRAAGNVVLAHVVTGDAEVDRIAQAGLLGLSRVLNARTSVEPITPMPVDIESDELSVFTFLYWPVTADQALPSPGAYLKLNRFLRSGGMILFDTRDADIAGFGGATPEGRRLQAIAAALDIPPLEPVPPDHVLTRSFYLLRDFPGRHAGRTLWVEAAPADAERAEGMPFRNLNDGVTPVVIGGNDWAAAWAVDDAGRFLRPVGRGLGGERQRELAYRFGVNLIMHVLTGNYKSDQVHVPALLERLGQ